MTQIISHSLKEINLKKAQVKNLSELFILYGTEYISVDKLDIATKTQSIGDHVVISESRAITSSPVFILTFLPNILVKSSIAVSSSATTSESLAIMV